MKKGYKRFTVYEKSMIASCYTYGNIGLNDNRYLQPIIDRVGLLKVEKELNRLRLRYTVFYNTSSDSEGCTYNSLVKNI